MSNVKILSTTVGMIIGDVEGVEDGKYVIKNALGLNMQQTAEGVGIGFPSVCPLSKSDELYGDIEVPIHHVVIEYYPNEQVEAEYTKNVSKIQLLEKPGIMT